MTLGGTAIDPEFESVLEQDLKDILVKSHYRDICNAKMEECIQHNEKCHDCRYRFYNAIGYCNSMYDPRYNDCIGTKKDRK